MGFFSQLFGGGSQQLEEMLEKGAVIVDVRTKGEFDGGHVQGSINVPLGSIEHKIDKIKKMKKPVVLCCASGARSGRATSILQSHGIECCNGGSWMSVNAKV